MFCILKSFFCHIKKKFIFFLIMLHTVQLILLKHTDFWKDTAELWSILLLLGDLKMFLQLILCQLNSLGIIKSVNSSFTADSLDVSVIILKNCL